MDNEDNPHPLTGIVIVLVASCFAWAAIGWATIQVIAWVGTHIGR